MSCFDLDCGTMLGLALAMNFSLLRGLAVRREELRRGQTVRGKAVGVIADRHERARPWSSPAWLWPISLWPGLLLFEAPAIRSIGISGALVVAVVGRVSR